jgi:hypothetical protein
MLCMIARVFGAKKPSEKAMMLLVRCRIPQSISFASRSRKRFVPDCLVCNLFPLVNLFFESLGLLFVCERQANHAVFSLKGVEKRAVLVVRKGIEYLLVPYHTAVSLLNLSVIEQLSPRPHTLISTNLSHIVLPTKSSASTIAPWSPV